MKKIIYIILIASFLLIGCSLDSKLEEVDNLIENEEYENAIEKISEYRLTSKDIKDPKHDYDLFELLGNINSNIEKEKYEESITLIRENKLLSKELKYEKYNFDDLITFNKIKKHYEEGEYDSILSVYKVKPIQDEHFALLTDEILIYSYKELMNDIDNYELLSSTYNQILPDTKDRLSDTYDIKENLKKMKSDVDKERVSLYLNMLKEKNYDEIKSSTLNSKDRIESNFYNIANAYIEYEMFLKNEKDVVAFMMVQFYLDEITSPIPEIKNDIENLQELIKKGASNFGVYVGMTTEEVLISQWGEPQKINTTKNAFGTREQWVYPNHEYLYFEDGILTSIQTKN